MANKIFRMFVSPNHVDHVFKQWVKTAVNDLNNPNDPARPWLIVILDHGHKLANSQPWSIMVNHDEPWLNSGSL